MLVSEVIEYAKNSELKQLSSKDDNSVVMSYIRLGIIELYKRFNLSIKVEVVRTKPDIKVYDLRQGDVNTVLQIYDSEGKKLEFKRVSGDDLYNITQLTPTSFLFKTPKEEDILFLYKASPTLPTSVEDSLELPYDMLEALLNYVGHKGQASMNKQSNIQAPTVNYYNLFEKSCYELEQRGYSMDIFSIDTNIRDKGFV